MRVLIVGSPLARGTLAAVRSLGETGWEVGFGCPTRDALISRSRWVTRRHPMPWPQHGFAAFAAAVSEAVEIGRYEAVFAGGDEWLRGVDAVRDEVPVTVPYAPSASLDAVMDKLSLAQLAREVGLSAPFTVAATDAALAQWRGPIVVKPRRHWLTAGADVTDHLGTVLAPDAAAANAQVAALRAAGAAPVLQEPVTGRMMAVTMLTDSRARPVAQLQQEAHRVWPTSAGVSTRATTVALDRELAKRCAALLRRLDWFGLAQLQFIDGDAGPQLIDLNARYYGSLALALRAGVNLPVLWARLATGRHVSTRYDAHVGSRYSWLEGDLRRAVADREGGLARDVAKSLAWARGAAHSMVDLTDPMPALAFSGELARRAARRARQRSRE